MKLARLPIPPKKKDSPSRSEAFPPSWYQDIKAKQFSIPFKRKRVARKIKELKENCFALLAEIRRAETLSGISKEVKEYQGGGFFKYYELEQYE